MFISMTDSRPQVRDDLAENLLFKDVLSFSEPRTAEVFKARASLVSSITGRPQTFPYLRHEYLTDAMNIERSSRAEQLSHILSVTMNLKITCFPCDALKTGILKISEQK